MIASTTAKPDHTAVGISHTDPSLPPRMSFDVDDGHQQQKVQVSADAVQRSKLLTELAAEASDTDTCTLPFPPHTFQEWISFAVPCASEEVATDGLCRVLQVCSSISCTACLPSPPTTIYRARHCSSASESSCVAKDVNHQRLLCTVRCWA